MKLYLKHNDPSTIAQDAMEPIDFVRLGTEILVLYTYEGGVVKWCKGVVVNEPSYEASSVTCMIRFEEDEVEEILQSNDFNNYESEDIWKLADMQLNDIVNTLWKHEMDIQHFHRNQATKERPSYLWYMMLFLMSSMLVTCLIQYEVDIDDIKRLGLQLHQRFNDLAF